MLKFVRPRNEYSYQTTNEFLKNYSNTMDAIFSSYTKNYAVLEIDLQIFEDIFKEFDDEYFENISPFEKKKGISDLLTNTDSRFMFVLCRYTK